MRINFKKIEIKNFLSYQNETFNFDEHKGINLIYGKNLDIPESKNGVGKSALSNALVYGLYGRLPFIKNKIKNENLPNRYVSDKNMSITLYFNVDSKKYKTFTGLKKGKSSFFELYEISKDGKENNITKSTIDDTKEFLANEILHCDMNLFMRTILLNTDPEYNFYNLGKQEKQDFIDRLFDTAIYGDMHSLIHSDVTSISKEIIAHQNQILVLNRNEENYTNMSNGFDSSRKNSISKLHEEYENAKVRYEEKRDNVVKKNIDLINKMTEELNSLLQRKETITNEIQKIRYEKQNITSEISSKKLTISDRRNLIKKHKTILTKVCKDCKRVVAEHYNLLAYQTEIMNIEKEIKELENKCQTIPATENTLLSELKNINSRIIELNTSINNQNYEYEKSQGEIRSLENSMNYTKNKLDSEMNSENPYLNLIEQNKKDIETESNTISELKELYKYKKYAESIVDQENLKKSIIRELILLLNNRIKNYLDRLGTSFEIVFDEDMNYDFITNTNTHPDFNNFSSGERARISFATCFAFKDFLSNRSGLSSNILILDEFIDGNVDSMAIDNIMEIVKEYSKKNKQNIYIVSHRKEIGNEMFNNTIEIVKKDHISKISVIKNV